MLVLNKFFQRVGACDSAEMLEEILLYISRYKWLETGNITDGTEVPSWMVQRISSIDPQFRLL